MFYCCIEVQCIINITQFIKDYLNNWIIVYLINHLAFILKACKYPKSNMPTVYLPYSSGQKLKDHHWHLFLYPTCSLIRKFSLFLFQSCGLNPSTSSNSHISCLELCTNLFSLFHSCTKVCSPGSSQRNIFIKEFSLALNLQWLSFSLEKEI